MRKWLAIVALSVLAVGGCRRPYDKPDYAEVDTAETAYAVPLEGDTSGQAKFQSEKFLEAQKVAVKRVQITHRWNQTGRWDHEGEWIPNVRVIKVNRSPITREWTADNQKGTANKDQAIWVESSDSVGFSMGFTATGYIKEEDASKFLYWYPSGSLEKVMDTEVRARVQQSVAEIAAKYPLDILRARKQEMTDAARKDVMEFFKERGISITTVSSFGGMTYENDAIQKSIDNVFIAQQEKSVNLAKFEAQQKANERITLEADATAEKLRKEAKGKADAKITEAEGEAKSLLARAQAIKEAGPALFQLRQLEIDEARVQKWDGRYPTYLFGAMPGQQSPNLLLNMPTVADKK
jgi:regulator of protease activity HflC (stomatin/prohibitin superfamily)